jgi:hypothetical protein
LRQLFNQILLAWCLLWPIELVQVCHLCVVPVSENLDPLKVRVQRLWHFIVLRSGPTDIRNLKARGRRFENQ